MFNTNHTYTNFETNLEILYTLPKGPKLNSTEQNEIYKHYKQTPSNILNDQIHYKTHTLLAQLHTHMPVILTSLPFLYEPESEHHHSQFYHDHQALIMVYMAPKNFG